MPDWARAHTGGSATAVAIAAATIDPALDLVMFNSQLPIDQLVGGGAFGSTRPSASVTRAIIPTLLPSFDGL